ncbi:putative zinc-binding protein [Pseudoalteromonas sp. OOF1S-7]|uniref:putative zinc-binding protein n=1 Tax=Pseudoalteromonas sp. OOF1S-7 TaxID=2917757 RepID=UPI001EF68D70|nr:putative zinc-binding protein [Pseudoalteromonas sp. OOF1S-7]MCG7533455.1 putative zinc-binding protein [Pseudoalteromonas sp. OOF1S-7]
MKSNLLPCIMSCSGCCHDGALSDDIAVVLQQQGKVERIAVAAIAAGSPQHLERLKQSELLIAIDGCALHCIRRCLSSCGVEQFIHFDIARIANGLPKSAKSSTLQTELQVTSYICRELAPVLSDVQQPRYEPADSNIIALFPCAKG